MLSSAHAPLYEIKANLFKALAHPLRVRILEILAAAPNQSCTVSALLDEMGLEASHLSQHLATLRRYRVVHSTRTANSVTYSLAHPYVAELLAIARVFLVDTLTSDGAQLELAKGLPNLHAAQ